MSSGKIASRRQMWSTVLQVVTGAQCIACTALPNEASFASRPSIDRVGTAPWSGRDSFGTESWYMMNVPVDFLARHAPGVMAYRQKVLILGGFGSELFNDIWVGSSVRN